MKKLLLYSILLLVFFSCASPYEKNSKLMSDKIFKALDDLAFKENIEFKMHEFNFLSYDTIDENILDEQYRSDLYSKIDKFHAEMEGVKEEMNVIGESMMEYAIFGLKNPLYKQAELKILAKQREMNALIDSTKAYFVQDSLIEKRISERINPKPVYNARAFVKATAISKGQSDNLMDTLSFLFDENMNIIPR